MKLKPIDPLSKAFLLKLISHYEVSEGKSIQLVYGDLLIMAMYHFCEDVRLSDDHKRRFEEFKELLSYEPKSN